MARPPLSQKHFLPLCSLRNANDFDSVPSPTSSFWLAELFGLSGLKISSEDEDFLNTIIYMMNFWTNGDSKIIKIMRGHFSEILASKPRKSQKELIEGLRK